MANLPQERLDYQSHPFTNVGMDYCDPFKLFCYEDPLNDGAVYLHV